MKETADWWLGQLDGPWFQALESAVQEEWGVAPLRIREGGVRMDSDIQISVLILPVTVDSLNPLPRERISVPCSPPANGPELSESLRSLRPDDIH